MLISTDCQRLVLKSKNRDCQLILTDKISIETELNVWHNYATSSDNRNLLDSKNKYTLLPFITVL